MRKSLARLLVVAVGAASVALPVSAHTQYSTEPTTPDLITGYTVVNGEHQTEYFIEVFREDREEVLWRSNVINNMFTLLPHDRLTYRVQLAPDSPDGRYFICSRAGRQLIDGEVVEPQIATRICGTVILIEGGVLP